MLQNPTLILAKTEFQRFGGTNARFILNNAPPSFEISRKDGEWIFTAPSEVELLYAVYDCAERFLGYDFLNRERKISIRKQCAEICRMECWFRHKSPG